VQVPVGRQFGADTGGASIPTHREGQNVITHEFTIERVEPEASVVHLEPEDLVTMSEWVSALAAHERAFGYWSAVNVARVGFLRRRLTSGSGNACDAGRSSQRGLLNRLVSLK